MCGDFDGSTYGAPCIVVCMMGTEKQVDVLMLVEAGKWENKLKTSCSQRLCSSAAGGCSSSSSRATAALPGGQTFKIANGSVLRL